MLEDTAPDLTANCTDTSPAETTRTAPTLGLQKSELATARTTTAQSKTTTAAGARLAHGAAPPTSEPVIVPIITANKSRTTSAAENASGAAPRMSAPVTIRSNLPRARNHFQTRASESSTGSAGARNASGAAPPKSEPATRRTRPRPTAPGSPLTSVTESASGAAPRMLALATCTTHQLNATRLGTTHV